MLAVRFKEKEAVNIFYSQVLMTKQGPLFKIWLAAHCQKKLTKVQILECDLETATGQIISSKVKIALRTSGHLLLGAVRILNRKAKYLLTDCKKVFTQMQKLLEPEILDLPKEKLEADYDSITLREEFHDFESHFTDFFCSDTTLQEFFSRHQSRPEEITLREECSYYLPVEPISFGDRSEVSRKRRLSEDKTLMSSSSPSVDRSTRNFFGGDSLFFDSPDGFGDGGVAEAMIDNILRNVDGGLVNDIYLTTDTSFLLKFPGRTTDSRDGVSVPQSEKQEAKISSSVDEGFNLHLSSASEPDDQDDETLSKSEKESTKTFSSEDKQLIIQRSSSVSESENPDDETLSKSEKEDTIMISSDDERYVVQLSSASENPDDDSLSKSEKEDTIIVSSDDDEEEGYTAQVHGVSESDTAEDTSLSKSGKEDETTFSSEDTGFSLHLSDESEPDTTEDTSVSRSEKEDETTFSYEDAGFTLHLSGVSEPGNAEDTSLSKSEKEGETLFSSEDGGFTLHLSGISEPENPDDASLSKSGKKDGIAFSQEDKGFTLHLSDESETDNLDEESLSKNEKLDKKLLLTEEKRATVDPYNFPVDSDDPDDIRLPKDGKVNRNLLLTEEEEYTLDSFNVSASYLVTRRKRKIKRKKVIIDEVKKLSRKDIREQFYCSEITPRVRAAHPSLQFMRWKEKSKPRVLLSTPAHNLGHDKLRVLFERNLKTTLIVRPGSGLTLNESDMEEDGVQSICETSMMEVSNAYEELNQPQTEHDMTFECPDNYVEEVNNLPTEESTMELSYQVSEKSPAQENFPDEVEPMDIDENITAEKSNGTAHGLLSTLQESNKKGKKSFSLMELCKNSSRKQAAATFYSLLLLKKEQAIEVSQSAPYEDIIVRAGPRFHDM
ncbi:double-strand-break repair protein rad21-like protein 1 [Dipodomys merriami]|uniref:double-strand-break repair protein rad21-like protein 1 n=1 Tax=Dipodomys merriami TaxID=94247 RepID=UPI0038556A6F